MKNRQMTDDEMREWVENECDEYYCIMLAMRGGVAPLEAMRRIQSIAHNTAIELDMLDYTGRLPKREGGAT